MSSARVGDIPVSSGRTGVSGSLVSEAVTSSSVPRLVSDVHSPNDSSTLTVSIDLCYSGISSVSSYSVSSSTSLYDFPLLGSSRAGKSFSSFYVFHISSSLPLGQTNPFAVHRSMSRVLWNQFPDIGKLRDNEILVKDSYFCHESGSFLGPVFSRVPGGFDTPSLLKL